MAQPSCGSCRFASVELDGEMRLECRRYPPQVIVVEDHEPVLSWPTPQADDWCGEWRPQEERGA